MSPAITSRKVTLLFNADTPDKRIDRWKSYSDNPDDPNDYSACHVFLGDPIFELDHPLINPDEVSIIRKCLEFWIALDMINLLFRKLGIPFMYYIQEWKSNEVPVLNPGSYITFFNQSQFTREKILLTLTPIILALQYDFQETKEEEKLKNLEGILELLGLNKRDEVTL